MEKVEVDRETPFVDLHCEAKCYEGYGISCICVEIYRLLPRGPCPDNSSIDCLS